MLLNLFMRSSFFHVQYVVVIVYMPKDMSKFIYLFLPIFNFLSTNERFSIFSDFLQIFINFFAAGSCKNCDRMNFPFFKNFFIFFLTQDEIFICFYMFSTNSELF